MISSAARVARLDEQRLSDGSCLRGGCGEVGRGGRLGLEDGPEVVTK